MNHKLTRFESGIAAALLLACNSPFARADNCTGVDVLVTQTAQTTELAKDHNLTIWKAYSVLYSPDSIYNNTTGECSGVILTTPDGKTQSMGYCARRDKDGDTQSISWHAAPGAAKGMWKATGGSGKFAGKQDSGWFQNAVSDGNMSVSNWGGTCK